jgi:hypothetical protein
MKITTKERAVITMVENSDHASDGHGLAGYPYTIEGYESAILSLEKKGVIEYEVMTDEGDVWVMVTADYQEEDPSNEWSGYKVVGLEVVDIDSKIEGTRFAEDMDAMFNVNGSPMARGVWNLLVSIRDVSLFTKGIKPHRMWRLKDVKDYFGVTGGKEKVLEQLQEYKEVMLGV